MQVWGKHFWGCRTLERSSVGPTRGKYTSRTVVLKATPASIWVWLASALNSRRAKKIAPTRRLSGQADTPRKRCQKIGPSGRRPNPKAVVSAMPVVMPKAIARIAHVVIASPLFYLCGDRQNRARTSVTAITFWSFLCTSATLSRCAPTPPASRCSPPSRLRLQFTEALRLRGLMWIASAFVFLDWYSTFLPTSRAVPPVPSS